MKALLIIDVQNDFIPGGSLEVKDGDLIIPLINEIQKKFDFVVGTQDWHPANHGSFAANHPGKKPGDFILLNEVNQVLWPIHCVQQSQGAAFHQDLKTDNWKAVFRKGTNPLVDSYSGFFDNNRLGVTGMSVFLKEKGIEEVFVCGLATDYCVKFTVLDALSEGFRTTLIMDACRAVNLNADDDIKSINEMSAAGAHVVFSEEVLSFG